MKMSMMIHLLWKIKQMFNTMPINSVKKHVKVINCQNSSHVIEKSFSKTNGILELNKMELFMKLNNILFENIPLRRHLI